MNDPTSRADAQLRADTLRTFLGELGRLEQDGVLVLSDAQKAAVERHADAMLGGLSRDFDVDRDTHAKQLSLGMRVASFLGALALAASVYFLFHQFWGLIATGLQILILAGASLGTLVLTYFVRSRDASGYYTKLAALLAFACFVLNVSMLGSTFNITPSDKAFIVWATYAGILAYACDLRLLLLAGLLCAMAFIAARVGEWGGMYWLDVGERPETFFPAALAAFALPSFVRQDRFAGFAATYRLVGLLALFLPMLVLGHYGRISYLDWDDKTIEHTYQTAGFAVSAAFIWLGARRAWPDTVNTSTTFFVIFLYTKFYDWWWDLVPKYVFFLVLGLTALLVLTVLRRWRSEHAPAGVRALP